MGIETIERDGHVHVVKNGVEALEYAVPSAIGYTIYTPGPLQQTETLEEAVTLIAGWMGNWYTTQEAAEHLVELGAYNKPPTVKEICGWAKNGLLPGSTKVPAPGQGGAWRIPESALAALAERRKR